MGGLEKEIPSGGFDSMSYLVFAGALAANALKDALRRERQAHSATLKRALEAESKLRELVENPTKAAIARLQKELRG